MALLKLPAHLLPSPIDSAAGVLLKLILSVVLCAATAACIQAQDPQQSSGDESWTKTTEGAVGNADPSRTTESHSKSGNRTVDTQKTEVLGLNGRYQLFSETETETIQVDATTTRTIVRNYRRDGNGQRVLNQVTEEESRTAAGGDVRRERKTSNADMNGKFQVVQREVADTKKVNPGTEETKSTVYAADGYGGLAQVQQTQEVKTKGGDNNVAVKNTRLVPDGNGKWKVSTVTEKTIKDDGRNRTTEERVSSPDVNGRLYENSRTVSKEAETATGEKTSTVETYSTSSPGYTDGAMHLNQRVTTTQKKDSGGELIEQQIEQPYAISPSDGPRVTGRTKYVVKYAGRGTQQTKTVEERDLNGNFNVTSVETQKSTAPPAPPKSDAPAPPDKP
jgi:hypothetical protein